MEDKDAAQATIAVLDNINLLPEAQQKLRTLTKGELNFPDGDYPTEAEIIARTGDVKAILISPQVKITRASFLKVTILCFGMGSSTCTMVYLNICSPGMQTWRSLVKW